MSSAAVKAQSEGQSATADRRTGSHTRNKVASSDAQSHDDGEDDQVDQSPRAFRKRCYEDLFAGDADELPLTLYDVYRKPRAVREDDAELELAADTVYNEFKCPICLGILKHTVTVMDCMHRFCSECIQKSLRLTRTQCPSCRIHVPSRRNLRNDEVFDALVAIFYPDLLGFEVKQDQLAEEYAKSKPPIKTKFVTEQESRQNVVRTRGSRKLHEPAQKSATQSSSSRTPSLWHGHRIVEFVLRRHPREKTLCALPEEFFRTVSRARIQHVKGLVRELLRTECNLEIIVATDHANISLSDEVMIEEILDNLPEGRYASYLLVLYFRSLG